MEKHEIEREEKTSEKLDYKELGLKAGIELHVQLDTKEKLFCSCSTGMEAVEIARIKRKLHPVASELGEIDVAAQHEYLKDRTYVYSIARNETCLVECDEEPIHELNREALELAMKIALLFNCKLPDEIHVMRKIVIDGSNTSGFQRTCVVGLNGELDYKGKKIEIASVMLEEDAAAIIEKRGNEVYYKLSRLGIPLVEVATGLLRGFTPKEIEEIAFRIGLVCKSVKKVKRGLGSIRQDLNVSIANGARVEIKGVQRLSMIAKVIENEVKRQLALIELAKRLKSQGARVELKEMKINNEKRSVILLRNFCDALEEKLFQNWRVVDELKHIAKLFNGDFEVIKKQEYLRGLDIGDNDVALLVKGNEKVASILFEHCSRLLTGPSEETRAALEDCTTRYMRPLPGAARLYPETDIPPLPLSKREIRRIKKSLPKRLDLLYDELKVRLGESIARELVTSPLLEVFLKARRLKVDERLLANVLTSVIKSLRREGVEVEKIKASDYLELFSMLKRGEIAKEAIPTLLREVASSEISPREAAKKLNLLAITQRELRELVKKLLKEKESELKKLPREVAFKALMGLVMREVRGRIDGAKVARVVREEIERSMANQCT